MWLAVTYLYIRITLEILTNRSKVFNFLTSMQVLLMVFVKRHFEQFREIKGEMKDSM